MAFIGISLGSNLGDRLANLRAAVARLDEIRSSPHIRISAIYETDPINCPPGSNAFYNAVIELETTLAPNELLTKTQAIEKTLGRPDDREVNAPRTLDLDLLYYDNLQLKDGPLILPHPRMFERAFVLMPLSEIRPDLVPDHAQKISSVAGIRRIPESLAEAKSRARTL